MKPMQSTPSRSGLASGFTLIEMLVVVVVIGVIASFIQMDIGQFNQSRQVEAESRRLFRVMQLASEEAILESKEMGLRVSETDYSFFVWNPDDRSWSMVTEDKVFNPTQLDPDTKVALFIEGDTVKMGNSEDANKKNAKEEEELNPQILFLSSGEISPFELELSGAFETDKFKLAGTFTGELTFKTPADEKEKR